MKISKSLPIWSFLDRWFDRYISLIKSQASKLIPKLHNYMKVVSALAIASIFTKFGPLVQPLCVMAYAAYRLKVNKVHYSLFTVH